MNSGRIPGTAALALIVVLRVAAASGQTVRYVDAGAGGANDGTSWSDAFSDLQDALAAAQAGDEMWVAAGVYRPDRGTGDRSMSFELVDGTALYGGFSGTEADRDQRDPAVNVTILSGDLTGDDGPDFANYDENSFHVVAGVYLGTRTAIDGFTISGGHANAGDDDWGAGVTLRGANIAVTNCLLRRNQAVRGGALFIFYGSTKVTDCLFSENSAGSGGAVFDMQFGGTFATFTRCNFSRNASSSRGGAVLVRAHVSDDPSGSRYSDCTFAGNTAGSRGGAISNETDTPVVYLNCVFSGNVAGEYGGGCFIGGAGYRSTFTGCTFSGNRAATGGGVYVVGRWPRFTNSVLWGNEDDSGTGESAQIHLAYALARVNYSCVQGWTGNIPGEHNIDRDPLFIDPAGPDGIVGTLDDNLRLQAASPCVDAGDNQVDTLLATYGRIERIPHFDRDGNARVTDYPPTPDTGNGLSPLVDMGAYEYQDCNTNGLPDPQDIAGGISQDEEANGIPDECQDVLHVSASAAGAGDGTSWADAFTDLQDALEQAGIGDQVWVAAGTYRPDRGTGDQTLSFGLPWAVRVLGGFADGEAQRGQRDPSSNPTILSGDLYGNDGPNFTNYDDNAHTVMACRNVDQAATLDGFTISGGNGGNGAGVNALFASPSIAHCIIRRNQASAAGGGMYSGDSSPTLDSCVFAENRGGWGGGLTIYGFALGTHVVDCMFLQNSAASLGGAVFWNDWRSDPPHDAGIARCRFIANEAGESGGGIYLYASALAVRDSFFSDNIANQQGGGLAIHHPWDLVQLVDNCTIVGNQAADGGGIAIVSGRYAELGNCILWGNRDNTGTGESAQISLGDGTATIDYSCLQGWTGLLGGTGNIGDDPRLKPDGLHLAVRSPARNAGDPDFVPVPGETDLDGQSRVLEGRVDMGADEAPLELQVPSGGQPMPR